MPAVLSIRQYFFRIWIRRSIKPELRIWIRILPGYFRGHKKYVIKFRVSDPDPDPHWIRIQSDHWIRIRNLNTDPDPDPGGQK
jgi:hypothetical protein